MQALFDQFAYIECPVLLNIREEFVESRYHVILQIQEWVISNNCKIFDDIAVI